MKACIVTGDRHAEWRHWYEDVSDALDGFDVVIHGDAKGIDTIANDVVDDSAVSILAMPAQWGKYGNAAGPKRNAAMLSVLNALSICGYEVCVLAFHPNIEESKGTGHMVGLALASKVPVTVCRGRYS